MMRPAAVTAVYSPYPTVVAVILYTWQTYTIHIRRTVSIRSPYYPPIQHHTTPSHETKPKTYTT